MDRTEYTTIIFDFFGVISSEVSPVWLKKYFPEKDVNQLKEKYVIPSDRGDITEEKLFANLGNLASLPPEKVRKEWLDLAVIDEKMLGLIKKLGKTYTLAVLSDTQSKFFREIIAANDLEKLFDTIIVSSEIHMTKEDPSIYTLVLKELGATGKDIIFVDDNPANAERARTAGITSFAFSNQKKLEESLAALGISTP